MEARPTEAPVAGARQEHLAGLLARTAARDQHALASLYDATSRFVYGLALRIVRDRGVAEEITVEVYWQVFHQAAGYDARRGSPLAWLLMLARSRSIDRLRADARRRAQELPLDEYALPACVDADPHALSATGETRDVVRGALQALSPEQRSVIELAYYHGLSQSEIAARLELPLGTVKTRTRAGLIALRRHFRDVHPEDAP